MPQRPTDTTGMFPSTKDLRGLRQKLKNGGYHWTSLTDAERWRYHAYDYGFRQAHFNDRSRFYPLDPDGRWYDEHYAKQTERFYRQGMRP